MDLKIDKNSQVAYVGMVTALMVVSALVRIPIPPVPITLQSFIVLLVPMVFGARVAFNGVFIYIILGLMGLPIFAHGGGPAYLLNPTFGYVIGFLFAVIPVGYFSRKADTLIRYFFSGLMGLLVIYICGVFYLFLNINFIQDKSITIFNAIKIGFLLPIFFDLIKLTGVSMVMVKLGKRSIYQGSK